MRSTRPARQSVSNEFGDGAVLAQLLPYSDHQLLADRTGELLEKDVLCNAALLVVLLERVLHVVR